MKNRKSPASILLFTCVLLTACAPAVKATNPAPTVVPATAIPATAIPPTAIPPTAIPVTTIQPTAVPAKSNTIQDASLSIPVTFSLGPGWISQDGIDVINIVKESPSLPQNQWWGPDIYLVDGAMVHDPADVVSNQPASADKSQLIAWPNDFFAYISALPGVKVIAGPDKVTIGGIQGSQIIVHTPAMQPILWLKGDYTWTGGETPEIKRQLILLNTHGKQLLLEFDDDPTTFDAHYPLVQEIFNSIQFGN